MIVTFLLTRKYRYVIRLMFGFFKKYSEVNMKINCKKSELFFLKGEIGNKKAKEFCEWLKELFDTTPNVYIILSVNGGNTEATTDIVEMINSYPGKTTCIASGKCRSAGIDILLSCDTRLANISCRFLVHRSKKIIKIKMSRNKDIKNHLKEIEMVRRELRIHDRATIAYIVNKTKLKTIQAARLLKKGQEFSAVEALEFGFINNITN